MPNRARTPTSWHESFRRRFWQLGRPCPTENGETRMPDMLQATMRRKYYQSTQRNINISKQLNRAVQFIARLGRFDGTTILIAGGF